MDDFREKIREFVGDRNQVEAARQLGISQPFLALILSGKRTPRVKKLQQIMSKIPVPAPPPPAPPVEHTVTWSSEKPVDADDFFRIPVLDPDSVVLVGGEPGISSYEQIKEYAWVHRRALGRKKSTRGLTCLFVRGDSMEPILRDGAIVCVDTAIKPESKPPPESIWAVQKGEGAVVKYIEITGGELWLLSENRRKYPTEKAPEGSQVIGRVIWVWQGL